LSPLRFSQGIPAAVAYGMSPITKDFKPWTHCNNTKHSCDRVRCHWNHWQRICKQML